MTDIVLFLVGQAIAIIIGLITIYSKITLKLKELEIRVAMIEKEDDYINEKLDKIEKAINNLAIQLQNKKDRE
jgi:chaperonin cofactor prefoldin